MKLIGSDAGDTLVGNDKGDVLLGGKGDDTLIGGAGRDSMTGGRGSDTFAFGPGSGKDVITDFDAIADGGPQDLIDATYPGDLAIFQVGKNTVINLADGDTLTLIGVKPGQIDETDFI